MAIAVAGQDQAADPVARLSACPPGVRPAAPAPRRSSRASVVLDLAVIGVAPGAEPAELRHAASRPASHANLDGLRELLQRRWQAGASDRSRACCAGLSAVRCCSSPCRTETWPQRRLVGRQIVVVAGQQVAALAGLGIAHRDVAGRASLPGPHKCASVHLPAERAATKRSQVRKPIRARNPIRTPKTRRLARDTIFWT